jgi:hypothetical protein
MIDLSDKFLLMIQPESFLRRDRVEDAITAMARKVWSQCTPAEEGYRGIHVCRCGQRSDNRDHFTPMGRTTNSLMVHYVEYHRDEVPESELAKLAEEASSFNG